jgi:hypothetical protein
MSSIRTPDPALLTRLTAQMDAAIERLAVVRPFAKERLRGEVLDLTRRLMPLPGGPAVLCQRARALEEAGVFAGTDWARPEILRADITPYTLRNGSREQIALECLSDLRLLAIGQEQYAHPNLSSEQARHYLAQVLALNLNLIFDGSGEADRARQGDTGAAVQGLLQYLVHEIGYDNIIDQLIEEIWRILAQRPVRVDNVKAMITQVAACLYNPAVTISGGRGADRLVSALFGPTQGCVEDPGLETYAQRIAAMDAQSLQQEATGFARAMHDTGLVSAYHAAFVRHLLTHAPDILPAALGLSSTGRDALLCYQQLIHTLIDQAVFPETCQAIYGLALTLERGVLYAPPVAPALWRQIALPLSDAAVNALACSTDPARSPRVHLLAGTLCVIGQPLGVGQGNNPTCQSARAISMWAFNDPDYLLQMIAWAARDNEVIMHFEGRPLSSLELQQGMLQAPPMDVDPVSVVLVPHLDRIYAAMGTLCEGRTDDPHRWINPEFHGWWVGRGFHIAVDIATGKLSDFGGFVRHFYASYNPLYNGNQPVIHPQPAGIAITDSAARFVGWHAITLLRVALDLDGEMRVYFYNPNNDSGQDLGNGVVVSTEGHGEHFGESSLPIAEFTSRLYIFHYDPLERGMPDSIPTREREYVEQLARASWARDR